MSTHPPRKGSDKLPFKDRRAAPGSDASPGSLRWLKSLFGRPLGLVRRGSEWHIGLVDRRRPTSVAPSMSALRTELRARLGAHENAAAAQAMRHLLFVLEHLRRKGWSGVGALPSQVMVKALEQAEIVAGQEASPAMTALIERLRKLHAVAASREEFSTRAPNGALEVSEVTQEEFDATERSWAGTVPPEFSELRRDE
jgi:hypothetical protein